MDNMLLCRGSTGSRCCKDTFGWCFGNLDADVAADDNDDEGVGDDVLVDLMKDTHFEVDEDVDDTIVSVLTLFDSPFFKTRQQRGTPQMPGTLFRRLLQSALAQFGERVSHQPRDAMWWPKNNVSSGQSNLGLAGDRVPRNPDWPYMSL